jgi:hypothetical protein
MLSVVYHLDICTIVPFLIESGCCMVTVWRILCLDCSIQCLTVEFISEHERSSDLIPGSLVQAKLSERLQQMTSSGQSQNPKRGRLYYCSCQTSLARGDAFTEQTINACKFLTLLHVDDELNEGMMFLIIINNLA